MNDRQEGNEGERDCINELRRVYCVGAESNRIINARGERKHRTGRKKKKKIMARKSRTGYILL